MGEELVPPPRRPRDRSPVEIREVETGPRQELGAGVGGESACGARCWSLEASQRIFGLHRDRPLLSGPAPFGSKEGSGGGLSDNSRCDDKKQINLSQLPLHARVAARSQR